MSAPVTPGQGQGSGCLLVLAAVLTGSLAAVVVVAQVVMAVTP